jgi:flagellar assembly protein FliH
MTNSSKHWGPRQVPPPEGGKPASAYARFIPREEMKDFAAWRPDTFGGFHDPAPPPPEQSAPAAPTLEDVQAAAHAGRQSGYQDGYRDGLVALEGFKQSFAQQMAAQIGQLVKAFEGQLDALEQEMATAIARTATQLARQVVRTELTVQPGLVAKVAEDAVNGVLLSARHIRVHVNPEDHALVAQGAAEALGARGARLTASSHIKRGGCLIESDVGTIDACIETRWAQAAAVLGQNAVSFTEGETR